MGWSSLFIGHLNVSLSISAHMAYDLPSMRLPMLSILPLLLVFLDLLTHFGLIILTFGLLLGLDASYSS